MRRKDIVVVVALPYILPLANALSLANFQQITSILIPRNCQVAYDSQIPVCTVGDFTNGCSSSCQASLTALAKGVESACSTVIVDSNTLLGIVKKGGVIQALCPTVEEKTTSPAPVETPTPAPVAPPSTGETPGPSTSEAAAPTTSPSPPPATSQTSTGTPTPATSPSSTGENSSASQVAATTTISTLVTAGPGGGGVVASITVDSHSTSHSIHSAKTTAAKASPAVVGNDGGGGSPFDIDSSADHAYGGSALSAYVMVALVGVVLGR